MDIKKQIEYWRVSSEEDLAAAYSLFEKQHLRHSLFFAHLSLEKILKALVVFQTNQVPPYTHDLLCLAEIARIDLSDEQKQFIARFQQYCIEGRYPEYQLPVLLKKEAQKELRQAKEIRLWLQKRLT